MQLGKRNDGIKIKPTISVVLAFCLPPLLAALFALYWMNRRPPKHRKPSPALAVLENQQIADLDYGMDELMATRQHLRDSGIDTDAINLRIWAECAASPEILVRVDSPDRNERLSWLFSDDSRYVLAVSAETDNLKRKLVALYDFSSERWLWKQRLEWPEDYGGLIVWTNNHCFVEYTQNERDFCIEIDEHGKPADIRQIAKRTAVPDNNAVAGPSRQYPGDVVTVQGGIVYTTDVGGAVTGYSESALPGFFYAGTGDAFTVFSGNGMFKYNLERGHIRVYDSLTQDLLLDHRAWDGADSTEVLSTLATYTGDQFSAILRSTFDGDSVSRTWAVKLNPVTGKMQRSTEASVSETPDRSISRQITAYQRWKLALQAGNKLEISDADGSAVARTVLPVGEGEVDGMKLLEDGHHIVFRRGKDFWILDFATAIRYADWKANLRNGRRMIPVDLVAKLELQERQFRASFSYNITAAEAARLTNGVMLSELKRTCKEKRAPAYLELRTQILVANRAWQLASALMLDAETLQDGDNRSSKINLLLQGRVAALAGRHRLAAAAMRNLYTSLQPPRNYYYSYYYYGNRREETVDQMLKFHMEQLFRCHVDR
ncbi:MAG: hypothetical protein IJU44_13275 [Kiritimatiellae bacterium]|nr:hypothetical protein [Kiritimatiellia bacterium]